MEPPGTSSGTCPLCRCEVTIAESLSLQACPHLFHSECLQEYIKDEMENSGNVNFKCPMEDCTGTVGPMLIQYNFPAEYENYIKLCAVNIDVQPTAKLL